MAHINGKLTKRQIETISNPGRYSDGSGLYLNVTPTGAKSWVLRTVIKGKRRDIGLGGLSYTPLQNARMKAQEYRTVARNGGDPLAVSRKAVPTFRALAIEVHAQRLPTWKNPKHAQQWINTLRDYAYPHIGEMEVDRIGSPEVLAVLSPIWTDKPETAKRVSQRLKAVLDVAKAKGFKVGENPVVTIRDAGILPKVAKSQKHHAAMHWQDIPAFYESLKARDAMAAYALRFLMLTGARTDEVLGATWDEIEGELWTVPASRMKAGKAHRVPLCEEALAILEPLRALQSKYVFEGQKRHRPLSNMAMEMLLRRMNILDATVHGFRSSFRDWAGDAAKAPREVAEACLAHSLGNAVEQAYARSDLLDRRRGLMVRWAGFVAGETTKILRLRDG